MQSRPVRAPVSPFRTNNKLFKFSIRVDKQLRRRLIAVEVAPVLLSRVTYSVLRVISFLNVDVHIYAFVVTASFWTSYVPLRCETVALRPVRRNTKIIISACSQASCQKWSCGVNWCPRSYVKYRSKNPLTSSSQIP